MAKAESNYQRQVLDIARLEAQIDRFTHSMEHMKRLLLSAQEGLELVQLRDESLEIIVEVTNSEGGYLHFFDEKENVIDLATWSNSVRKICDAEATIHYPLEEAGIWADCARQRKAVVHNDYQAIPDSVKGGLPEGHFPLYRHMSIPVIDHGKIVAIVGVGNKEEPYDDNDVLITEVFMGSLWSVLQQRKAAEILERYSYEDGLTGIANRRRFNEVIKSEWNRMRRKKEPLCLIMVDIDFFKGYNDHYGHAQGDICLTEIAATLQKSFRRSGDLVTRYGGEEFAIIIPYMSLTDARLCAEVAHKAVYEANIPYPESSINDRVTVSMGVASLIPENDDINRLVENADANLYQAKVNGRNQIVAR